MLETQGGVVLQVEVAAEQPRCLCCDQPAFGESVIDSGLCIKHTELRIFIWRLQKRGEALEQGNLHEYMTRVQRPVTFDVSELPELWKQYQALKEQGDGR